MEQSQRKMEKLEEMEKGTDRGRGFDHTAGVVV